MIRYDKKRRETTRDGMERNARNETTRHGKTRRETERKRTKETRRNETKWCKENINESKYPYLDPLTKKSKTNRVKFSIFLILSIGFFFSLRIPTAGMELLVNGRYHCMKRVSDNFFIASGLGKWKLLWAYVWRPLMVIKWQREFLRLRMTSTFRARCSSRGSNADVSRFLAKNC